MEQMGYRQKQFENCENGFLTCGTILEEPRDQILASRPGRISWIKDRPELSKKIKKKSKKLTLAVPCVVADKEDRGFLTWQDRFGCLWYLAMMMTRTMIMIEMLVIMMIVVVDL